MGLWVDGLWVYGLWFMVYGFMVYGFMVYIFMGYSKIGSIKNPTNHLIIRIIACPDCTHVRIQTKEAEAKVNAKVYGLYVYGLFKILEHQKS